jgi:hypothetical protein
MGKVHTHYDNLKVSQSAPLEVIRAAYRALAQKHHPDVNPSPESAQIMRLLNEAYQVLSDPDKRTEHDRWIAERNAALTDDHRTITGTSASQGSNSTAYWYYKCQACGQSLRMPAGNAIDFDCNRCGQPYSVSSSGNVILAPLAVASERSSSNADSQAHVGRKSNHSNEVSQEIRFPVQIDGFTFHELGFSVKGRECHYENIASLKFQIQNTTINFSTDETYILGIRTHSDEVISICVSDAAFTFNKKNVAKKKRSLLAIADYINNLTFQRRLDAYLEQMRKTGCMQYKVPSESLFGSRVNTIFIYENGDVSLAGKTVNLRRAREAGTLKFGTAYGLGCDRSINPFEISINESPPIFGGRAEGAGSLRFDAGWDFPMVFEILKSIENEARTRPNKSVNRTR